MFRCVSSLKHSRWLPADGHTLQRILPGKRLGGLVAGGSPPSGAAAALHACTGRSLGGGHPPTPNTLPSSTASGYNVFLKRSSKTTWLCQRTTARSFPPSPSLLPRLRPGKRHICSAERGEKCSLSLSRYFFAATFSKLALMRSEPPVCCSMQNALVLFSFLPSVLLRRCPLQGRSHALLVF